MTPDVSVDSPAHGVVVLRVAEAGGLQLAAHHGAGALVSRQVALQSTLAVHARTWRRAGKKEGVDIPLMKLLMLRRGNAAAATGTVGCVSSLTVLLQAFPVPRSLPPEGDDGLRLRLVVQGLHAARGIGTVAGRHAAEEEKEE